MCFFIVVSLSINKGKRNVKLQPKRTIFKYLGTFNNNNVVFLLHVTLKKKTQFAAELGLSL